MVDIFMPLVDTQAHKLKRTVLNDIPQARINGNSSRMSKLGDKVSKPFLAEALVLKGTDPDEFYFIGGTDGTARSKAVYVFNAKENKIDEVCQLNQARSGAHGFIDGEVLFVIGGDSSPLSFEKITIKDGKAISGTCQP